MKTVERKTVEKRRGKKIAKSVNESVNLHCLYGAPHCRVVNLNPPGIANKKENLTNVKYLTKRYVMSLESLTEQPTENRLKR